MKTDISNWEVLSRRPGSTNYISPDRKWMVKTIISSRHNDLAIMKEEQRLSDAVREMGIPTPDNDGIVELEGNEYGIVYEFIDGKKSLSRAMSEDKSRIEELMKKFDELRKSIHFTECDTDKFESVEEKLLSRLETADVFTDEEKAKIKRFIEATPKQTTCLHGDFHPGNFITAPSGDYIIDLGNFSYGNPLYDWGHWWFMSNAGPEELAEDIFHTDKATLRRYWEISLENAFDAKTDQQKKEMEDKIKPYAVLSMVMYYEEKPVERWLIDIIMNATGFNAMEI